MQNLHIAQSKAHRLKLNSRLERSPRMRNVAHPGSQPRKPGVVKRDSDSSTAKLSVIGVSVTGPRR